jgi:hypothetical protein
MASDLAAAILVASTSHHGKDSARWYIDAVIAWRVMLLTPLGREVRNVTNISLGMQPETAAAAPNHDG